jgi:uncharacterized membrane protein
MNILTSLSLMTLQIIIFLRSKGQNHVIHYGCIYLFTMGNVKVSLIVYEYEIAFV